MNPELITSLANRFFFNLKPFSFSLEKFYGKPSDGTVVFICEVKLNVIAVNYLDSATLSSKADRHLSNVVIRIRLCLIHLRSHSSLAQPA